MLTTAEAAERLKITKRSVARLCKRGTIKAELRGRDYWIEDSEVERYSRERRPAHRPVNMQTIHSSIHKTENSPVNAASKKDAISRPNAGAGEEI